MERYTPTTPRSRRADIVRSTATVGLIVVTLTGLAATVTLDSEFGRWAWARHHNILSWYIRPLFFLPFCYWAYRRSLLGITLTVVALATSMFWFPAPANPSPATVEMLALEREYLTGEWNLAKVSIAALVPILFAALALAL